jgi:hypothetical protein
MIPEHTREALVAYLTRGIPTGDFTRAVLTGNLFEAAARADGMNRPALAETALWIRDNFPLVAYGSPAKVDAWIVGFQKARQAARGGHQP